MSQTQSDPPTNTTTLYAKLTVGMGAFIALVYFAYLHITSPEVTVPYWLFAMWLGIMGSTLGIDILAQAGSAGGK